MEYGIAWLLYLVSFSIINALGFPGFVNLVKSFQWKVAKAKKKEKKILDWAKDLWLQSATRGPSLLFFFGSNENKQIFLFSFEPKKMKEIIFWFL